MAASRIGVKAAVVRGVFGLPKGVRRLLAGPPVRIDGQELDLDAQLVIRPQKRLGLRRFRGPRRSRPGHDTTGCRVSSAANLRLPVATREIIIAAAHADIPTTLYTPADLPEPSGLLVYTHGGGFSVGSRVSHDPVARYLASHAGVRVLSVEYRRAPEHPFPVAVDDAIAAFEFAHGHAAVLGADCNRIAVGGDSAGGNLAAVTAQQAVRRGGAVPAFQLLMYPPTDLSTRRPSHDLFAERLDLHGPKPAVGHGQLHTAGNRSGRSATVAAARRRHRAAARLHRQRRFRSHPRRWRGIRRQASSRRNPGGTDPAGRPAPRVPELCRPGRPVRRSRERSGGCAATRPRRVFRFAAPRESR